MVVNVTATVAMLSLLSFQCYSLTLNKVASMKCSSQSIAPTIEGNFHRSILMPVSLKSRTYLHLTNSSPSSSSRNDESESGIEIELTPQERILKEALGIEPETQLEKRSRLEARQKEEQTLENKQRINVVVALLSFVAAILNYGFQYTHPVTSLALLSQMQVESSQLNVIGTNGRPTVVDFWAPVS
mmetsp:Transcript_6833/g.9846  ORF Transcript_6833/g.9846 Transcript_6833/m.9846 type:complete len:186 (-) Transcript_6833:597-1154(-)